MPIDATSAANAAATQATGMYTTGAGVTQEAKKSFDQEVFLALLVAQMRYQDPTSPMDTSDMMAQSTQLASMEQLTAVADTSRESFALQMRVAAINLVGQEVSYVDADGEVRTGVVDQVSFETAVPMVQIGDETVALDAIAGSRRVPDAMDGAGATPAGIPVAGATGNTTDSTTDNAMDGTTQNAPASGDGSAPAA